jgi:hypothetical protein
MKVKRKFYKRKYILFIRQKDRLCVLNYDNDLAKEEEIVTKNMRQMIAVKSPVVMELSDFHHVCFCAITVHIGI